MSVTLLSLPSPKTDHSGGDSLLMPFLSAADEERAARHLDSLLNNHAAPVVTGVVRSWHRYDYYTSAGSYVRETPQEQDTYSDVMYRLTARLWGCRTGQQQPIANFKAYTATVSFRVCHAQLREKHRGYPRIRPNPLRQETTQGFQHEFDSADEAKGSMPCRRQIGDTALSFPIAQEKDVETVPAPCGDLALVVADRLHLLRLWQEIELLPLNQRRALLLNLRDDRGRGVLSLLPLCGLVDKDTVAHALEIPLQEMADLWAELPWEDDHIALRLGVTRQQIINLRMTARKRLARRLINSSCAIGNF